MNKMEIVKAAFDLQNPAANEHLADSFQGTDSVGGQPTDKATWAGMEMMMKVSIPDLANNVSDIKEDGDDVLVTAQFTGTFTKDMDLSAVGMGVVPATGKALKFPASTLRVFFEGDKIKEIRDLSTGPDAGQAGFMKALGVKMG